MSKAHWTTIAPAEIQIDNYRGPHKWGKFKSRFLPWPYCKNCGLWQIGNRECYRLAIKPCPPVGW